MARESETIDHLCFFGTKGIPIMSPVYPDKAYRDQIHVINRTIVCAVPWQHTDPNRKQNYISQIVYSHFLQFSDTRVPYRLATFCICEGWTRTELIY